MTPTNTFNGTDRTNSPRIVARFHPQVWQDGYAIPADPLGETAWDVTEYVVAHLGREMALAMQDDQYESDDLARLDMAPEWVRDWSGPFWVGVEQRISDYFTSKEAV
jgi:hypothetical protein